MRQFCTAGFIARNLAKELIITGAAPVVGVFQMDAGHLGCVNRDIQSYNGGENRTRFPPSN